MTHDFKFIISTIIFHCVNKTLAKIQKKWKSYYENEKFPRLVKFYW